MDAGSVHPPAAHRSELEPPEGHIEVTCSIRGQRKTQQPFEFAGLLGMETAGIEPAA